MVDFSKIKTPVIFQGDSTVSYRDPTMIYHEGVFRLFCTVVRREDDYLYLHIGESKSVDLVNWSEMRIITPHNLNLNYSSPGNIIRYQDRWIMCFQTYCMPQPITESPYGNKDCRVWISISEDLDNWSEPELLRVKGNDVSVENMGRMIDPYLIEDISEPGKYWCMYKQNGVSLSFTYDMKNWIYQGHVDGGENVCILKECGKYMMIHSPDNGIGIKSSSDLKTWEDLGVYTLAQEEWEWAQGRLTAAFVLNLKAVEGIGKYLMLFHGSRKVYPETEGQASIALAWGDDLYQWQWGGKLL